MYTKLSRAAIAGLMALAMAMPLAASADDDHDNDQARDLLERGEIHALSEILRVIRERAPGDVVAIDLVHHRDRWIYRFQIIGPDGRRTIVDVDARAATVIRDQVGD